MLHVITELSVKPPICRGDHCFFTLAEVYYTGGAIAVSKQLVILETCFFVTIVGFNPFSRGCDNLVTRPINRSNLAIKKNITQVLMHPGVTRVNW